MKHLGDITKIKNAPFVDCITFGSPCFPAGTLVLTDKGYIGIENIKVGDRCLTHAGNWEFVTAVGHKEAPTVKLKGSHYGIVTTYNHPFYSAIQEAVWNGNGYDRTLSCVGAWTPAAKMCGKRWAVPNNISGLEIPKIDKQNKKQNDPPEITPELMYVIGRWLADGWVIDGQRPGRPKGQTFGQIYICANSEKADKLEEAVRSVLRQGGKLCRTHERTVDKIKINNQALCKWLKNNFGSKAAGKEIPAWAFCMPKEHRESLVNGYFDGDGYVVKDGVWKATTVSKKLAHGIRLLCETLGYSCSVYYYETPTTTEIEGRTVSQKPQYQVRVSKKERTNCIKYDGFNWYKCSSVEPYSGNQTVYNITVDKDHSYIVEGFVVHNCQDLSIAGKRLGLAGERSGLFMDAIRVIKEMRYKSGGKYPTFAVWENVLGAFSSNNGEDFRAVLEELARIKEADISIPRPEKGKWGRSGVISGDGYSIAWRTFDAQYWGVPQRRRRIAVVMDFGGQRAGEVLFECESVSGYTEPSVPAWKGIARNPADCVAGYDRLVAGADIYNGNITGEVAASLTTATGQGAANTRPSVICLQGNIVDRTENSGANGIGVRSDDVSYTLNTADRHVVCYGITSLSSNSMKSDNPNSGFFETDICKTLDLNAANPTCNQGGIVVVCRASAKANAETYIDLSPTLMACNDSPPIVFESHSQDARYTQQGDTSPACTSQWGTGGNNMPLVAKLGYINWIVRRLTPTECERLQGFPDGWTDIGEWVDEAGKKHKPAGGPRYKALGNSIALPQWFWLTCKMAKHLPEHATLGSLFDGIGGFPLVWETYHGKGTAVWASEIEQFPIAVTKRHFKEE